MQTTISTTKGYVEKTIASELATGIHMPLYLHSSPGIGKSAIIRQITDEMAIGFVDVRLAQMEQSDVAGIPYVSHGAENGGAEVMRVSIPEWFPSKERITAGEFPEQGVLFFDEMSNAPVAVQHAAYRIVLDREVHRGCELGDGWVIVSAGNKKEDKTGAKGVAPALANRFAMHFDIKADLDDFTAYAIATGISTEVIGFLNFNAAMLYRFEPKSNEVSFATPRSWEQVSNLLKVGFSEDELSTAVGGCVGDAVTSEFMAFRKYYESLPDFRKIMSGELEYKIPKNNDRGITFALTSSLITNLAMNAGDADKVKRLGAVMDQLDDDFLIMTYKTVKNVFESQKGAENEKMITNILMNTMESFKRVSSYIRGSK